VTWGGRGGLPKTVQNVERTHGGTDGTSKGGLRVGSGQTKTMRGGEEGRFLGAIASAL